jgi:hypothetical protein
LKDFKEEEARKQNKYTANCILVVLQLFWGLNCSVTTI